MNSVSVATMTRNHPSGYVQLVHLPTDHTAAKVCRGVAATFEGLPEPMRLSLTWDQGSQMAAHATVAAVLDQGVFFAHPGSPWQRGSNENTNGRLRQYFPKSTDLSIHSALDLREVENRLNNRPRKRHASKTPAEIYAQHLSQSDPTGATAS